MTTVDELQAINSSLSAHYVLGNDINASETETWNNGAGFAPIGNNVRHPFSGNFDGQGYKVDGLYIHRPNTDYVGFFGRVNTTIKNIGVTNLDIQGDTFVGGLVGFTEGANIINSFSSGEVSGDDQVGGLVGINKNTKIETSYSNSNVSGNSDVGGLVGYTRDNSNIYYSYSNSNVSGTSEVGGLVGDTSSSYINKSYSTGSVTGGFSNVGGLVGSNDEYSTVADSYWNTETSNQSTSAGSAIGLTTDEMTGSAAPTNMVGFDFTSEWRTVSASDADSSADSYPILDSSEEEEAVIVSESSSEEYGGMSTLVYVALFFVLFSVMVLLLVKD